jgi:hypothetical protein
VDALADLCARADERMRIDHRPVADVRTDVDVHRRHADDTLAEIRAIANGRTTGNDPHATAGIEPFQRHRVFVDKRPPSVVGRHVDDDADAKPEEDSLLDPGLTRQPEGADVSGSAARAWPADNAARSRRNASRACSRSTDTPASNRTEISEARSLTE